MRHRGRIAILLAVAFFVVVPVVASACPVCISGSPRIRMAFFNTTIFLSFLPLGIIAAGVLTLKRLGRGKWAAEFEDRDAVP